MKKKRLHLLKLNRQQVSSYIINMEYKLPEGNVSGELHLYDCQKHEKDVFKKYVHDGIADSIAGCSFIRIVACLWDDGKYKAGCE